MKTKRTSVGDVDRYIAGFPRDVQRTLQEVRSLIREAAPDAQEAIKYGIPTFVLHENLVHFAAFKRHIGLYPTPSRITAFKEALSAYRSAKGSIQFPLDEPLPLALIRAIVAHRVEEVRAKTAAGPNTTNSRQRSEEDMKAAPRDELIRTLKDRFAKNPRRHAGIEWSAVEARLAARPEKLKALAQMERTGGEPDVVGRDEETGELLFCDCSPETPAGRRSLCYDRDALDRRKENKPVGNAVETAASMGIELLTEEQYRALQELAELDRKTSSWVKTPARIRELGGALFCDRRYDQVFVYHNGADSYYASRGFRGQLRV
jgi:uncharacterized protein YdhG (YjbR/CyaY superfamily)